ncbi:MAG: lysophospholipid acyltransferase family protein [Myxococcales bacterium]|nr:lysophospholipid acyltransferase family protein [Myxococcales bacterium]
MTRAALVSPSGGLPVRVRDQRLGERWSTWQRCKNAGIRAAVRCALGFTDHLPASTLRQLGRGLGRLVWWFSPGLRRRARERATDVMSDDEARRVAQRCFVNAGESLALSLLLRRPDVRASDFIDVAPAAEHALRCAGGAVVVSAHLGPFELIAPRVTELGLPTAVVVRESYDKDLDPHIDEHRLARGVTVIHRGRAGAPTRMVRALRTGRLLGVLADLPARVETTDVIFLGRRTLLPTGPARLALAAHVPLLVASLTRPTGSARFQLHVRRIDSENADAHVMTQRVVSALSEAISSGRDWWLWMAPGDPG